LLRLYPYRHPHRPCPSLPRPLPLCLRSRLNQNRRRKQHPPRRPPRLCIRPSRNPNQRRLPHPQSRLLRLPPSARFSLLNSRPSCAAPTSTAPNSLDRLSASSPDARCPKTRPIPPIASAHSLARPMKLSPRILHPP